jgi:hypothetical protein
MSEIGTPRPDGLNQSVRSEQQGSFRHSGRTTPRYDSHALALMSYPTKPSVEHLHTLLEAKPQNSRISYEEFLFEARLISSLEQNVTSQEMDVETVPTNPTQIITILEELSVFTPGFEMHLNLCMRILSQRTSPALSGHLAVRLWNALRANAQLRTVLPTTPSLQPYMSIPFGNSESPELSWFAPYSRSVKKLVTVIRDRVRSPPNPHPLFDIKVFCKQSSRLFSTWRLELRLVIGEHKEKSEDWDYFVSQPQTIHYRPFC